MFGIGSGYRGTTDKASVADQADRWDHIGGERSESAAAPPRRTQSSISLVWTFQKHPTLYGQARPSRQSRRRRCPWLSRGGRRCSLWWVAAVQPHWSFLALCGPDRPASTMIPRCPEQVESMPVSPNEIASALWRRLSSRRNEARPPTADCSGRVASFCGQSAADADTADGLTR